MNENHFPLFFQVWNPSCKESLRDTFVLEIQSTEASDSEGSPPEAVFATAFDGSKGFFIAPGDVEAFLQANSPQLLITHDAARQFALIGQVCGSKTQDTLKVLVSELRVVDIALASAEASIYGPVEPVSLERRAMEVLGRFPREYRRTDERSLTATFGKWKGQPIGKIEQKYIEFAAFRVRCMFDVYVELTKRLPKQDLRDLNSVKPLMDVLFVKEPAGGKRKDPKVSEIVTESYRRRLGMECESDNDFYLVVNPERFIAGPWLGHKLDVFGAIQRRGIAEQGVPVSAEVRKGLRSLLRTKAAELRTTLVEQGFQPKKRNAEEELRKILEGLQSQHMDVRFRTTATGDVDTSRIALASLANFIPFVRTLLAYEAVEKLLTATKQEATDIPLDCNAFSTHGLPQAVTFEFLPREVQELLLTPTKEFSVIRIKYPALTLVAAANIIRSLIGRQTNLMYAVEGGQDVYGFVAADCLRKRFDDVNDDERAKAHAVVLGLWHGLEFPALQALARARFDVSLSEEEAENYRVAWRKQFPEVFLYASLESSARGRAGQVGNYRPLYQVVAERALLLVLWNVRYGRIVYGGEGETILFYSQENPWDSDAECNGDLDVENAASALCTFFGNDYWLPVAFEMREIGQHGELVVSNPEV